MVNLFRPIKTTSEKLVSIQRKAGQLIFVTDKKRLYIDISSAENGRLLVSADSFIDVSCDDGKTLTFVKADGTSASAAIAVDDKLLADSANAVQNKVVHAKITEVLQLISDINTALDATNGEIGTTNANLALANGQIAQAMADILTLQTAVSNLESKDEELTQKDVDLQSAISQNQNNIQINADAISNLQQADIALTAKDGELNVAIASVEDAVKAEETRAKKAEALLTEQTGENATLLAQHDAALEVIQGTGDGSISQIAAAKVAEVVDNAPEDLNTLKELATWLNTHGATAAEMNLAIETNASNIALNDSAIQAEEERAIAAENVLESSITEVAGELDSEVSRAKAAEQVNAAAIDALTKNTVKDVNLNGRTLTVTMSNGTTKPFTTQDTTYDIATASSAGLISADDKVKLDNFAAMRIISAEDYALLGSTTANDGVIYFINGNTTPPTPSAPAIETVLLDFEYTNNGDETYTIVDWKGTLNGQPSTDLRVPDDNRIIV